MRELGFRAFIKPLGRYATGLDNIILHKCCGVTGPGIWSVVTINGGIFECDNLIVEQYTGLKDKNGKKIYEGDIVDVWIGGCKQDTPYIVEDMRDLYSEFHHDDGYYQFSEVKIVGNIHENSELLEEEK